YREVCDEKESWTIQDNKWENTFFRLTFLACAHKPHDLWYSSMHHFSFYALAHTGKFVTGSGMRY
ncbi:MAG: hypothetical protein AAB300_00340, partial [Nitrospirota bacterium]